uniref:Uncharacterized protein n=1 Tax=Glycine max TaxID=3847 RepID=C6TH48_SOYBN|nr:unknown [Glycine max]
MAVPATSSAPVLRPIPTNRSFSSPFRSLPTPTTRKPLTVFAMAPKKKVNKYNENWKKEWFGAGIFYEGSEEVEVGRVQEAGEEEGFEQRGESRLALQGRTIRILALFHREARRLLQSRRARLAQLARPSRQLLPLRPRLRRHPRLRRRNRRRCHHSR